MKRTERHHLKDNELANLTARARHLLDDRSGQLTVGAIALAVVLIGGVGYWAWNSRVEGRADALLAEALITGEASVAPPPDAGSPPPASAGLSFPTAREKHQATLTKFKVAADEYPSTRAGIFARYRQAATYMALGEPKGAAEAYQQVIDRGGNGFYGQMARLGLAEVKAQTGEYDAAIATFTELSQQMDGPVPVDGVLARLARVYVDAGKQADAEKTWNRLVAEFPDSPFTAEARRELDRLKKAT